MMTEILLLTKSTMKGGFCIAGIDTHSHKWIRLVQNAEGDPLNGPSSKYQNAEGQCEALDIVSVDIAERVPCGIQSENCRVKSDTMHKVRSCSVSEVLRLCEPENHEYIFCNTSFRLTDSEVREYGLDYSLMFVQVQNLTINYSKKKADFLYNGRSYKDFAVTDPKFTAKDGFLGGSVNFGAAYLVVSMPKQPYRTKNYYYKFVAKILM